MHGDFFQCKYATFSLLGEFSHHFSFQWVCGIFFLNRLTPFSKGKLMPKDPNVKRGFDDFFFLA